MKLQNVFREIHRRTSASRCSCKTWNPPRAHTFQNDVFAINYISIEFIRRQQIKGKDLLVEILMNDIVKYNPLCWLSLFSLKSVGGWIGKRAKT